MKITKAVIPAAGLGTRMLPIARSVPKEILPIVDRPAISYLVDEAAKSGITDILIITGRNKNMIEDYFDYSPEYEDKLRADGKEARIEEIRRIAEIANITFLRQHEAKGLGHAIYKAKSFTGNDPFVVLYGDDIIFSKRPSALSLSQLMSIRDAGRRNQRGSARAGLPLLHHGNGQAGQKPLQNI